jgi:hypothetical protein
MGIHYGKADFINYGKPSLLLDFARNKSLVDRISGNNLITFTRSSIGTYVGADGLIKTAAADEARFDHDPTTGESLGLLNEESRTNLLTYSEDFSNAFWNKQNGFSITSNTAIAPDGTLTADTASRINLNAEYLYQNLGLPAGTYTLSCWVKSVNPSSLFTIISFSGTDGSQSSPTLTATNTWKRFSHTVTVSNTVTGFYPCIPSVSGEQFYIWGAQVEAGSFSTSYIPTSGSQVTRQPDNALISGTNFSSWFNTTKGTIIADFKSNTISTTNSNILSFDDGTRYPWPIYRFQPDNYWKWYNGNDIIVNIASGFSTITKFGLTFDQTNGSSSLSGTLTQQDNSDLRVASKYSGSSRLYIFRNIPDGYNAVHSGTLKQLIYYPERLTNTQLQSLTQ